jgi:hypothetical protein
MRPPANAAQRGFPAAGGHWSDDETVSPADGLDAIIAV